MRIEKTSLGPGLVLVALTGRLDMAGATGVEADFKAACEGTKTLLVDLSGTSFMASIGIRLLLAGAKGLRKTGGTMVLFACEPMVERVLRATGVDQLIAIHETREEALAAAASSVSASSASSS